MPERVFTLVAACPRCGGDLAKALDCQDNTCPGTLPVMPGYEAERLKAEAARIAPSGASGGAA